MTHIPKGPLILLSRRRLLGRLALGGSASLALAACGGGGGDDSSSKGENLKDVYYNKLRAGMDWTDVERVVGYPANNLRSKYDLIWVESGVRLSVTFASDPDFLPIGGASLSVDGAPTVGRDFL